jgi:hypothetical protein
VDIKVDRPPYASLSALPFLSAARRFAARRDESPAEGETNRVYVRVRNRGPVAATQIRVRLYWAFAGAGLPALPSDFWTNEGASSSDWHLIDVLWIDDLPYCGSSVAGTDDDRAAVLMFEFRAPRIDPSNPDPRHYCLLAEVSAQNDPVDPKWQAQGIFAPDDITPWDNNVTHKNVHLRRPDDFRAGSYAFWMHNPFVERNRYRLRPEGVPPGVALEVEPASVLEGWEAGPGEKLRVRVSVSHEPGALGELDLVQERLVSVGSGLAGTTEGAQDGFQWVPFGGTTLGVETEDPEAEDEDGG